MNIAAIIRAINLLPVNSLTVQAPVIANTIKQHYRKIRRHLATRGNCSFAAINAGCAAYLYSIYRSACLGREIFAPLNLEEYALAIEIRIPQIDPAVAA